MKFERKAEISFNSELFCDAKIFCGGESISTHRLFLGAGSKFLRTIIKEQSPEDELNLVIPDFTKEEVNQLLSVLYGNTRPSKNIPTQLFNALGFNVTGSDYDFAVECNGELLANGDCNGDLAANGDLAIIKFEDFEDDEYDGVGEDGGDGEEGGGEGGEEGGQDVEMQDLGAQINTECGKESHPIKTKIFPCDMCTYTAKTSSRLNKHITSRHKEVNVDSASSIYPRQCARCDYVANSKATHWYHMRSQHTGERFPCDQCEYSATQLSALKVHMQSKHEGMKFLCDECDYVSTFLTGLRQHKRSKHEAVRYPCDQCKHVSTTLGNLKQHRQIRHDGMKFFCELCGYSTTKQFYLREHRQNVHEGVRYPCDQCDYVATRVAFLKRHKESRHLGVRYTCDYCEYAATRKDKLKIHVTKKHSSALT